MDVKLCRLCANKKDSFVGIYDEEGHKLRIELKISQCLQIEMFPEDPLPKMVCLECCSRLEQSYRFMETSHVAQITLQRLFPINEENCQNSVLKEESLVELLPIPATSDHSLVQEVPHETEELATNMEDGHDEDVEEEEDNEEEEEAAEEEEEEMSDHDSLEEVPKEVVDMHNNENERGSTIKKKRQSVNKQQKIGELSELEIDELMAKDKQWQQYPWSCSDCSQELMTVHELREHHQVIHKQVPRYVCAQCSRVNTQFQAFFRHIKHHRNLLKYRCEECGKSFSNKRVLDSHATCHGHTRPHICPDCGKAFRHQNALFIHSRCHLPDDVKNKYYCDQCDKRFSTKPNLVTHKRIHTGVRNFTCDQCGKSFIQKGNLDAHMLTHSQDKPFTCQLCNKGFKTAMQLRKHHSVHTGAKPHQCDVCGRSFRERGTLREHLRIHTGAMPFTCEYCGKAFRFKGILTTHRRQHTGERPYSCLECQHHFTNWPNYNKHMKRRHGINTSRQTRAKPPPSNNPPPLEPLPLYEDYAPAPLPPAASYHHPSSFTTHGFTSQQFFTFSQTHLDPTLDMLQHR